MRLQELVTRPPTPEANIQALKDNLGYSPVLTSEQSHLDLLLLLWLYFLEFLMFEEWRITRTTKKQLEENNSIQSFQLIYNSVVYVKKLQYQSKLI